MAADRYTTTMYDEWLAWLADQNRKQTQQNTGIDPIANLPDNDLNRQIKASTQQAKTNAQNTLISNLSQSAQNAALNYGSLPQDPGYMLSRIDTAPKDTYTDILATGPAASNYAWMDQKNAQEREDIYAWLDAAVNDRSDFPIETRIQATKNNALTNEQLRKSADNAALNYGSLPQDTGTPIERIKKPTDDNTQKPGVDDNTPKPGTDNNTPKPGTDNNMPKPGAGNGNGNPTVGSNPTPTGSPVTSTAPAAQQQTPANNQTQPLAQTLQPLQAGQPAYDAPPAAYDPASYAAYQQALNVLLDAQGNAPTYTNPYETQLQNAYDAIVNRPKFNYDLNEDMLYRQYAQNYQNMGRLAMQDTMGQAAALTGGYGSSYGQAVGQQQYNAYLQQLNNIVPELYQQAYQQYRDEGNDLLNQYSILDAMADKDYGRYQDDYNRWLQNRNFAADMENQAYNRGLSEWRDAQDIYNRDRAYDNQQLQAERDYQMGLAQLNYNMANNDREYQLALDKWNYQKEQDALALAAAEQAAAGGSGGSGTRVGYDKHGYTEDMIKDLQRQAGLKETGVWGENEKQAYKAGFRASNDTGNTGNGGNPTNNNNMNGKSFGAEVADARGIPDFSTVAQAQAYLRSLGVNVSDLMTQDTFEDKKYHKSTSRDITENATYIDYLRAAAAFYKSGENK